MPIEQKTLSEFRDDFLAVAAGEADVDLDTRQGSVVRALGSANAVNNMYNQTQVAQLELDSHLDTAEDDALDTWVNQFTPAFPGRVQAAAAYQAPVPPTALLDDATADFIYVASVSKLVAGQQLRLTISNKVATCDVAFVEPTRELTTVANPGDTTLDVDTTDGAFVGAPITLTDGNFSATAYIQAVLGPTELQISALGSVLSHAFATATTVVRFKQVLEVENYTFTSPAVLGDFLAGSVVTPLTLLEGLRFFRNSASASSPTILARTDTQVGYKVQTEIDTVQYEVVEDLTNPNYDPDLMAYKIPANTTEVYVKVEALTLGTAGNVAVNTLVVLPNSLTGVDGCTNPFAISNGREREGNIALRKRFRDFNLSRGSATKAAVSFAIASISADIQYTILENVAVDGVTSQPGNFVILVNDLTGALTPELLTAVSSAVDIVRPLCSTYSILPPTLVYPTIVVVLSIDLTSGLYTLTDRATAVQQAIYDSFQSQIAGVGWDFNELLCIAKDIDGVVDVLKLTVDGDGFDMTSGSFVQVGDGPSGITSIGKLELARPALGNITVS